MSRLLADVSRPAKEIKPLDENMDIPSDGENNEKLNNSLEVPLESFVPEFEDPAECNDILNYIDVITI